MVIRMPFPYTLVVVVPVAFVWRLHGASAASLISLFRSALDFPWASLSPDSRAAALALSSFLTLLLNEGF